ncbi:MAG TPA: ABC transporter permease subunit [Gemmatimonadales bacterium]
MTPTLALCRFELSAALRGRTAPYFAAGFGLAGLTVALVGLSAGGVLAVQGFARTSVSLLELIVWVVPILALISGAVAGADCHELEFTASLPLRRHAIVFSRWAASTLTLGAAVLLGLGSAGLVIGMLAGSADGWRYLRLIGVALLVLSATLALGLWIGVAAHSRFKAVGVAVAVWFALVIGVDLAAIGALAVLPPGEAGPWLSVLLMASPVNSARALGLSLFHTDVVAGPTGAALRAVLGQAGAWALTAALIGWTVVPLGLAGRRFSRSDL